jgi:prevent-host-death family protein
MANPIFSDDVVPVSDLKVNPGRVISQLDKTRRLDLVTSHGWGVAVVQSVKDYEAEAAERVFLKAIVQGVMDVEEGRTVNLADAKKRFGLG